MAKQPELDDFRVPYFDEDKKSSKFSLDAFDPAAKPFSTGSKESDRARLSEIGAKLDTLQERLHAQQKRRPMRRPPLFENNLSVSKCVPCGGAFTHF